MTEKDKKLKILLKEYEKSQDSAEHHDRLSWQTTSIFFATIVLLLGFVIKKDTSCMPGILLSIVGMIITLISGVLFLDMNSLKNKKYDRCKYLEHKIKKEYGQEVKNHIITEKTIMKYYVLFIILLLTLVWISIILVKACPS